MLSGLSGRGLCSRVCVFQTDHNWNAGGMRGIVSGNSGFFECRRAHAIGGCQLHSRSGAGTRSVKHSRTSPLSSGTLGEFVWFFGGARESLRCGRRFCPRRMYGMRRLARFAGALRVRPLTSCRSKMVSAGRYPWHFHISQLGPDCPSVPCRVCSPEFLVKNPRFWRNESRVSYLAEQIQQAVAQAGSQYYRLVIIAGLPGSGKTAALQQFAVRQNSPVVNVNLELSQRMLEMTRVQRSRQVERLLREMLAGIPGDTILLDNLEILFYPELEIEPLRLLQLSSRNRTIVASWNGCFKDGTLTYAEPGHPEFQQFRQPDAVVMSTVTPITS